jgi:hypothetical protein
MVDGELKKVTGIIEGLEKKATGSGETFFKLGIDGRTYNWFIDKVTFTLGDYVEGLFTEAPNPKNPTFPYKNIKGLEVKEKPKNYEVTKEEKKEADGDVYELGMAKNNSIVLLAAVISTEKDPIKAKDLMIELVTKDYETLVKILFDKGVELRKKTLSKEIKEEKINA